MLGIVFALSASLCWGTGDFLGGLTARRLSGLVVAASSQLIGVCVLTVVVLLQATTVPRISALVPGIIAGAVGAFGIAALYQALAIGVMSVVAPISATSAAVPVIVGAVQGERPSDWQILGMILAGFGILLASARREDSWRGAASPRKSILLALFTAICLGFVLIGIHTSTEKAGLWAVLAARITSFFLLTMIIAASSPRRPSVRGNMFALCALGILDVAGISFYAVASLHGLLTIVSVAASLYPVVTVMIARLVLDERVMGPQRAGMVSALIGVLLLAAG